MLHLHLSHLADALIQSDLQIGALPYDIQWNSHFTIVHLCRESGTIWNAQNEGNTSFTINTMLSHN